MKKNRMIAVFMSLVLAFTSLPVKADDGTADHGVSEQAAYIDDENGSSAEIAEEIVIIDDYIIDCESECCDRETDGCGSAGTYEFKYAQTEARKMLDRINDFRKSDDAWYWNESDSDKIKVEGLKDLQYDYGLEKVAMLRAIEIAHTWSHTRPNGKSCFTAWTDLGYPSTGARGENIAYGYVSEEDVFTGWREDDRGYSGQGHRRNMLSKNFNYIGIGHVIYNGRHYWVQDFGSDATGEAKCDAAEGDYKAVFDDSGNATISKTDGSGDPTQPETPKNELADIQADIVDIRSGRTVDLDCDDGVPKVFIFGGISSCGNCNGTIKNLSALMPEYRNKIKVFIFDIKGNDQNDIVSWLNTYEIDESMIVAVRTSKVSRIQSALISRYVEGSSYTMPLMGYVSGKGEIIAGSTSIVSTEELRTNIKKLLNESEEGTPVSELGEIVLVTKEKYDLASRLMQMSGNYNICRYKSNAKSVASVSKTGIITGKYNKAGSKTTFVTAYGLNNEGFEIPVAKISVTVYKPAFKFTGTDLTYPGMTVSANGFLSNVPEGKSIKYSVPVSKTEIMTVDENTGVITAGYKNGKVKVGVYIGEGDMAGKQTAELKVKFPKLKEEVSIKNGKTKKLTLKNVSGYNIDKIQWKVDGGAVSMISTAKNSVIKLYAVQSGEATVIATLNDMEYKTKIYVE